MYSILILERFSTFQKRRRRSGMETSNSSSTSPRRENSIHLQVAAALASFCALRVDADRDKSLQTKMMRNLFTMQQDFTNCVDYWVSLTILESLAARDQDEIHYEYADAPLDLMLKICQKNHRDEEVSRRLLNLLPYFLEYAIKYGYSSRMIVHTLVQFYKCMYEWNYGVLVHVDYMKCVCNCVRIDPSFSWNHDSASDDGVVTLLDSILDYIGNMLFVLRSQAVRCLQELLSLKNVAHKWKEQICIKVEKIAFDLLDEVQQSSSDPQKYEH